MRTRRPALSSISETAASGGASGRGDAQTASRCSRLIWYTICIWRGSSRSISDTGQLSSASGSSV